MTHIQQQPLGCVAGAWWIPAQFPGFQKPCGHDESLLAPCWQAQLRAHKLCGQESRLPLYLQRLSFNIQLETLPTVPMRCLGSLPKPT